MNDIIVSRFISGVTEDGETVRIAPGRYPFVDELGREGANLRTIIELSPREDVAIAEADYAHIRQEVK